jgi:hypothetical protein
MTTRSRYFAAGLSVAPRRSEFVLQGGDDGAERVGAAKAHETDREGVRNDKPAVKQASTGQGSMASGHPPGHG